MTRTFLVFLVGLALALAIGVMSGYVLGVEHGAKAGYTKAMKDLGRTSSARRGMALAELAKLTEKWIPKLHGRPD